MPAITKKAVNVTLLDADPKLMLEAGSVGGKMRVFTDTIFLETANTGDALDRWVMAELPSNSKILSIKFYNDEIDAHATPTLAYNLGIYNGPIPFDNDGTAVAAGGVVDVDAYASALLAGATTGLGAVNTIGEEVSFEARNITAIGNFMWEDCGLLVDPNVPLRIAVTLTTGAATHADGDLTIVVTYVQE